MQRRDFLRLSGLAAGGYLASAAGRHARGQEPPRPNVLIITVDDMSCDSVGAFGCRVPGTTPNIDRLASEGTRFAHAHVQVANCVPSRNVMQTGRYPHCSGVEGFYQVEYDGPILPELMKQNGYLTAIKGKVSHSTPYHPYEWDLVLEPAEGAKAQRSSEAFRQLTQQAIDAGAEADKPFYLLMNVTDPHKPFYGVDGRGNKVDDPNVPSRIYSEDDIVVPGFLPDLPKVRTEVALYYSSVRRADDCVGAILGALEESGQADNTVVMFLSDHGMPFPFAKTSLYHHSTHTPWIVRWPDRVEADTTVDDQMISAVDFMPTVLDFAGIDHPEDLDGQSFLPILLGERQDGRDMIFKDYNENAGAGRHPMRGVDTRKFGYLFNPWSDGERKFKTATTGTATYRKMVELAPTDEAIAARLDLFNHRVREEFYDYENDPDALHNLIHDPRYQDEIDRLRKAMEDWMVRTNDHCLEAFRNRDDDAVVAAYMERLEKESADRRERPELKRGGGARRQAGLIELQTPRRVKRGEPVTITVEHKVSDELGEQLLHVTLKEGDAEKRIERKVLTVRGEGSVEVTFEVPDDLTANSVRFAVFIGKDYQSSLQHIQGKPVPVE